jgi:phosphoribosylaminoimidazole-succinocarboxamide synthase
MKSKQYAINKGLIIQKISDKITIFNGERSEFHMLNNMASLIFLLLKKHYDKEKIIKTLTGRYEVGEKVAKKDVDRLLKEMMKKRIILAP